MRMPIRMRVVLCPRPGSGSSFRIFTDATVSGWAQALSDLSAQDATQHGPGMDRGVADAAGSREEGCRDGEDRSTKAKGGEAATGRAAAEGTVYQLVRSQFGVLRPGAMTALTESDRNA
jgi:hypothetical protein